MPAMAVTTPVRTEVLGIPEAQASRLGAVARVHAVLGALPVRASSARLRFTDDNGPKGGPAIRCALTVKLPRRTEVHVEECGTTARLALDGAIAKLERRLGRVREVVREQRRHPKKYYAAARALRSE